MEIHIMNKEAFDMEIETNMFMTHMIENKKTRFKMIG